MFVAHAIALAALLRGAADAVSAHPLVLVVAFDGFGYEYMERGLTPTLQQLADAGVSTEYMFNVFPTLTCPNFVSISTGLYPEVHGVIGNCAFNENFTCLCSDAAQDELFHYNDRVTPLWTLNELSGKNRYSGSIKWTSASYEYRKRNITYKIVDQPTTDKEKIELVSRWFLNDAKPANLIFLYFDQLDDAGHMYGPDSPEVNATLRQLDDLTANLLHTLTQNGLRDKVNLIFLSDHGMLDLPSQNKIDFRSLLDNDTYTACGGSPIWQIKYKPGFEKEVCEKLTDAARTQGGFSVYRRDEIPERWHVKHNKRQADLLLVADPHYYFSDAVKRGDHGYDPDADKRVRPIFIANGPAFKSHYKVQPFSNLDIFPLVATMLKLDEPLIKPNGTLTFIKDILKT